MEWTLSARSRGRFVLETRRGARFDRASAGWMRRAYAGFGGLRRLSSVALPISAVICAAAAVGGQIGWPMPGSAVPVFAGLAVMVAGLTWRERSEDPRLASLVEGSSQDAIAAAVVTRRGAECKAVAHADEAFRGREVRSTAVRDAPNLAEELHQAAALAQLTARMSHELRTPLNAVIGFSEVMKAEMFGPLGSEKYQNYAGHIQECGQTLLKSTEDTLALTAALAEPARNQGSSGKPLAFDEIVDDAWAGMAFQAAQAGIWLSKDLAEGAMLIGDRRVYRQILVNLFQEAIVRAEYNSQISIAAQVDGHVISFAVKVDRVRDAEVEESLALCVARTLLSLHGHPLKTTARPNGTWRAEAQLERAVQSDFFTGMAA